MQRCCLVDVRNEVQFGITHLTKAVNVPFKAAERDSSQIVELAASHDKVFIMCRRGVDSKDLTDKLLRGNEEKNVVALQNVINVEGGISAWSKQIDSAIPYY